MKKSVVIIPFSFLKILAKKPLPRTQWEREKQGLCVRLKPVGTMYLS